MEYDGGLQFFKEEIVNGAVYNIYLKKVYYDTSFRDEEDDKARLQWKLEEQRFIKYGTLDRLVECLYSSSGELNTIFSDVLFVTYRSFTSPKLLAQAIIKRYNDILLDDNIQLQKETCRRSLITALTFWVDHYPEDFEGTGGLEVLDLLEKFAKTNYPEGKLFCRVRDKILERNEQNTEEVTVSPCMKLVELAWNLKLGKLKPPLELLKIDARYFAEQLTYLDSELFKKVIPYHCLGSIWSRRNDKKSTSIQPITVYATVEQFNAVSCRVIATILKWPYDMLEDIRVKILAKWIDIAQECRLLKNFSSLKAIVAALQANPIYRLKALWNLVSKDKLDLYKELANIFNEENNQNLWRDLLEKEGTAKFSEADTSSVQKNKKSIYNLKKSPYSTNSIQTYQTSQGTVPYLGTFLTDLVMLDTAFKDTTSDGLINFEKKRKEFEMLARIRLFQSTATNYKITPDGVFYDWFYSIRTYNDNESHELSLDIQPSENSFSAEKRGHKKNPSLGFFTMRRRMSMDDVLFMNEECFTYSIKQREIENATATWRAKKSQVQRPISQQLKNSATTLSLLTYANSSFNNNNNESSFLASNNTSNCMPITSNGNEMVTMEGPKDGIIGDTNVIPVRVFFRCSEVDASNNYKTIAIYNTDHSTNVINNVLTKFNLQGKPEEFTLSQILQNSSEIELPERGNIFYAIVRSSPILELVVRRRQIINPKNWKKPPKSPKKNNKLLRIFTSMSTLSS